MEQHQQPTQLITPPATVVIQNQVTGLGGQAAPQNIRPFSTGICGCFEDCGGCMFAYCCGPCFLCSLAGRLRENFLVPICIQGGLMAMRTKVRVMYGIQGSICDDWCCMACCPILAPCQLDREMKHCGL